MSAAVNGNAGAGLLALQLGEKPITANAIRVNAALRIENPLPPKRRIMARRACLVLTCSSPLHPAGQHEATAGVPPANPS